MQGLSILGAGDLPFKTDKTFSLTNIIGLIKIR